MTLDLTLPYNNGYSEPKLATAQRLLERMLRIPICTLPWLFFGISNDEAALSLVKNRSAVSGGFYL